MSIKLEDKILTYEQAKELKFFMRNCTGVRNDFYALLSKMEQFKTTLGRLEKTCHLIETHFGKEIEEFEKQYFQTEEEKPEHPIHHNDRSRIGKPGHEFP